MKTLSLLYPSAFKFIPKETIDEFLVINVHKDSIKEGLKYVLEMPSEDLIKLAEKNRNFVLNLYDMFVIANRMIGGYQKQKLKRISRCVV